MRRLTLLSLLVISLLIGGWTYQVYTKNEQLKDPDFIYEHYLSPYRDHQYRVVAVQYSLKPGFIVQWEPHWKIYLYGAHRLIELEIGYNSRRVRNYSTALDYSRISAPVESFRGLNLPNGEYSVWIYVPKGNGLVEYPGGCVDLDKALDNGTVKLVNSTFWESAPRLELIKMESLGSGVLAFHYYHGCNCSGTWVLLRPYNETHDSVSVIYPWGKAEGYSPSLKLQPFNGTHYRMLAKKLKNRHCGFLGGIVANVTGIYVNPDPLKNFRKILEEARKGRQRIIIPTITVYRNGTVKEGGIGIMWPSYGSG